MRFTKLQYEKAIKLLQDGMKQLEPDGNYCAVCGDSGHCAHECHHNPLRAMALCVEMYDHSQALHEILHGLIGANRIPSPSGLFMAVPDDSPESE